MRPRTHIPQLTLFFLLIPTGTIAQCPSLNPANTGWAYGSNVVYSVDGLPADLQQQIVKALTQASGSTDMGVTYQQNTTTQNVPQWIFSTGVATVNGSNRPAATFANVSNTVTVTAQTVIDYHNQGGTYYDPTQPGYSTIFVKKTFHELGHLLGENDEPIVSMLQSCGGQTAGISVMNNQCGINDQGNNQPTGFQLCDANTISTNPQIPPPPPPQIPPDPNDPNPEGCIDPCAVSPIMIDLDGSNFPLTSLQGGVSFDLDADGIAERTAWSAAGSSVAFLALDRNGNGKIDNGAELFGDHTPQPASAHPNGFLALAEYDKPENGGNGNGIIDSGDAVFNALRLWIDSNHDGVTQPSELHTLSEFGITSISLDYRVAPRTDQYGNRFRYRAKVTSANQTVSRWAYDVFFVTSETNSATLPRQSHYVLEAFWNRPMFASFFLPRRSAGNCRANSGF